MSDNDVPNSIEDQPEASEEHPIDPHELVYEHDAAPIEEDQGQEEGEEGHDAEAEEMPTTLADTAEVGNASGGLEEAEEGAESDVPVVLEDEPIVYASEEQPHDDGEEHVESEAPESPGEHIQESSHNSAEQRGPEDPSSRVTTAQQKLNSAEGFRDVDALMNDMDAATYRTAGSINDTDGPEEQQQSTTADEDDAGVEELVVADVDSIHRNEQMLVEKEEEEEVLEDNPELMADDVAAAVAPINDQNTDLSLHLPPEAEGSSPNAEDETTPKDDSKDNLNEIPMQKLTNKQDVIKEEDHGDEEYANMHPAIVQAMKTRNDRFPLLDDSKLPHTRENFNLPPAVDAHTVPVERGSYQDYVFDLERQEYLQKEEVTKAHTEYLETHYELKQIISDFLTSVLMDKPADVYQYAADYFDAAID